MSIARKIGIMVFCGVPAIVGGGIAYALTGGSYEVVAVYQVILLLVFGAFVSR